MGSIPVHFAWSRDLYQSTAVAFTVYTRARLAHAGALAQLGTRSGGAQGLSATPQHCPLELVEILRSALHLQPLCHRQVQHTKPNTTSVHRGWTTTSECGRGEGLVVWCGPATSVS